MAKIKELQADLKNLIPDMETVQDCMVEEPYRSIYLGSFIALDPCGRFHCILSPNGATKKCERFWEQLDKAASNLGGWIESGEGDPTDIYFCMPAVETNKPDYCTQNNGDCVTCSLVNYGRDCQNNKVRN